MYSIGFHDIISSVTSQLPNSNEIASNIWVVFNILLEYSCRTQFESVISTLNHNYREQMSKMNKDLLDEIERLKDQTLDLTQQKNNLQMKIDQIEADLNKEKNLKISIYNELQNSIQMHEREVNMRLKFEAKLNNITGM